MTIEITTFRETNSLIEPRHRTFYPSKIPQQHHQLKNFISTVERDTVYYASRNQIYALHTVTRKRERIATLSWVPQCLGAGHGWICVGANDKGRCAFIKLGNNYSSSGPSHSSAGTTEVDDLLPLDLDPHSRVLAQNIHETQSASSRFPWLRAKVEYYELGGTIVNSITVHQIRSEEERVQTEIVAVIANNDQTVRIFSLTQRRVLQTLDFPTPMNHATISPDGKLLAACGDEPCAFFRRRRQLLGLTTTYEALFARYDWRDVADAKLKVATSDDMCFSTTFSPSGHMCAVASQTGTITIFDTSLIRDNMEDDEAVIDMFKSSRSGPGYEVWPGAVRSMAFGPEPWDLFAWAEDQGRVCVTDLRNHFQSRQTIELDVNAIDVERVDVSDLDDEYSTAEQREMEIEARFIQRQRDALAAQDDLAAVNHAADYMELAAERRRLQRQLREAGHSTVSDADPYGLTEGERQVLDSLRMERQRYADSEAERQDLDDRAFSIHYLPPSRTREVDSSTAIPSSVPHNTTIRQYMRERNLERNLDRTRPAESRNYQPRRRSSVVISNSNASNPSSTTHPSSLLPIADGTSTISASPSRLTSATPASVIPRPSDTLPPPSPLPVPNSTTDPWETISAAMAATSAASSRIEQRERELANYHRLRARQLEGDATEASVTNFERRIQATARMERLRNARLRQMQDRVEDPGYEDYELEMLRRLAGRARRTGVENVYGVFTMGIGWSTDGMLLYVGTEEGIMEFKVNLQDRKTFPAVAFR